MGVTLCHPEAGPCPGGREQSYVENATQDCTNELLEELMHKLFSLQNLKGNNMLAEEELIKLNEKIAMLHYGVNVDKQAIKDRYTELFRSNLDPHGKPVPYAKFRVYMLSVLREFDADPLAQEMILEQFIAEAQMARRMFYQMSTASETDWQYMPKLSQGSWDAMDVYANSKALTAVAAVPMVATIPAPLSARSRSQTHGTDATYDYMPLRSRSSTANSNTSALYSETQTIFSQTPSLRSQPVLQYAR